MINELEYILNEGESYTVEFKESPDKSLPEEVCAFANASGGRVYIGVHNDGYVVGTDTSNNARSRIQDTINKIEPRLDVIMEVIDNIIVLTVPEGMHKPYSCPAGFYMRSGPNSQKLDRDSIIEFFQSEGRVRYDEIVRDDLPVAGYFNEEAYKKFIRLAKISEVHDKETILKNLKCAAEVRGELCFTNAGALFFRKNDDDIEFRHAGVVCALYKGTEKVYILDAKELGGDLINKVDDAVIFLKKHLRLSYKIESVRRENILELPEDALREAIVNAVSHRDYFEKGARIMVEVFDDRVEVVSPGGVCKGITPENFGSISLTRNNVIVNLLHRCGYIEQMGTGINRMRNAAREAGVTEPKFELSGFFKVIFKRSPPDVSITHELAVNQPNSRLIDIEDGIESGINGIKDGTNGINFIDNGTENKREKIITSLLDDPYITQSVLAVEIGVSVRTVARELKLLREDGTIKRVGSNRVGYWEVLL
ncbi:MAG: putative DNA binding domain-containing protein [Oscillospiraceae bacterium]|nr:putative DNA binding domain-containing protein [Oscillospiraceae bacterium]